MDVYEELTIDLMKNCSISRGTAERIVDFLSDTVLDYDNLKEYYFYENLSEDPYEEPVYGEL